MRLWRLISENETKRSNFEKNESTKSQKAAGVRIVREEVDFEAAMSAPERRICKFGPPSDARGSELSSKLRVRDLRPLDKLFLLPKKQVKNGSRPVLWVQSPLP